jgi:hypothetical protein
MKYQYQVFYRQLFFALLMVIFTLYLGFFSTLTQKVFSGFVMQLIFLFDASLIHPQNLLSLVSSYQFLVNFFGGVVWCYLSYRFAKSVLYFFKRLSSTSNLANTLSVVSTENNHLVFDSEKPLAFAIGYFHPRVYLSNGLLSSSTSSEVSSILFHELGHCHFHDPLRSLIVDFISEVIPPFPFKTWFFGQYQTIVEVSCDSYSQNQFAHPTSLISALLKVHQALPFSQTFVSNFSAQSERIKILVGKKSQPFRSVVLANFLLLLLLAFSSSFIDRSRVFMSCQHILECVENIFAPDHSTVPSPIEKHDCNLSHLSS